MGAIKTDAAWAAALPEMAARLLRAFTTEEARFVLVGAAARQVALGDGLAGQQRLEFVSDADAGLLRRTVQRVAGGRLDGERRRASRIAAHGDEPELRVYPARTGRGGPGEPPDRILRDLSWREITIHAIAIDESGAVIDPHGGLADLHARRLRTIRRAEALAAEKPRWMLRMARHVSYYGFSPAPEIVAAARRQAAELLDVPRDLWREELERALLHHHPDRALLFLQEAGLLAYLLPEVVALVGFHESCPVHHKDIWEHTRLVVQRAEPTALQRWTALLHDVGKAATRSIDADGSVHFLRHEELSAVLFEGIAARLCFPETLAEDVGYLIRNHSRVNLYSDEWTDSAVRRLVREVGERLDDLLAFSRADITSRREAHVERLRRLMDDLEERVVQVREEAAYEAPLPKGIGTLIVERFELTPGPMIGVLRDRLAQAVEDGTLPRGLSAEAYVDVLAEWVEAEREA